MKVKLKKKFEHHGKTFNEGDEYEGPEEEIRLLVQQGYCDAPPPEDEDSAADKPRPADKPADKPVDNPPVKPPVGEPPKKPR